MFPTIWMSGKADNIVVTHVLIFWCTTRKWKSHTITNNNEKVLVGSIILNRRDQKKEIKKKRKDKISFRFLRVWSSSRENTK